MKKAFVLMVVFGLLTVTAWAGDTTISVDGVDLLRVSRSTISRPDVPPDLYQRTLELLGPGDGSQDLGRTYLYGPLTLAGDNWHSTKGIGPVLSFKQTFQNTNNRHFYVAVGDTWNNPGSQLSDVIFHSWDDSFSAANHVVHMVMSANGNVGIGQLNPGYKLHVNGNAAGTSWINLSSKDYKENISKVDRSSYEEMLNELMQVDLTTYTYKKDYDSDSGTKLGFIAEEMPKEVLSGDGKGVDIYELLAYTIGAMKAQQHKIATLEEQIKKMGSDQ